MCVGRTSLLALNLAKSYTASCWQPWHIRIFLSLFPSSIVLTQRTTRHCHWRCHGINLYLSPSLLSSAASSLQLTHINSFEPIEPILLQFAETLHIGIEMATKATKNVEKAKLEEVKEVAVRGLPPEGLSMASGDGYGAKNLQSKS